MEENFKTTFEGKPAKWIEDQQSDGVLTFDFDQGHVTGSQSSLMLQTITAYHSFAVVTTVNSSIEMTVTRAD